MALDRQKIDEVAFLARLEIEDAEKDQLVGQLSGIITFCEQLSEIDTNGVEPMTSVIEQNAPLRADKITDGDVSEKVLANAPDRVQDFFAVPKVVE